MCFWTFINVHFQVFQKLLGKNNKKRRKSFQFAGMGVKRTFREHSSNVLKICLFLYYINIYVSELLHRFR